MQPAQTPHPHRRTKRYAPAALGATLLLALAACSGGGGTSASPSATATPSPSATSAKATPSPTRTVTITESTPTPGTVQTATAEATVTPGTITTASATASAQTGGQAQASSTARASSAPSSTASLSSSEVKSAGGTCGTLEATGYLKHDATIQVASGAVDCLFAKELIRQFVVQNPAEVTDKANGERTVMSARCYWKPGDGVDRATPECVSLDGGGTVITAKLTN